MQANEHMQVKSENEIDIILAICHHYMHEQMNEFLELEYMNYICSVA